MNSESDIKKILTNIKKNIEKHISNESIHFRSSIDYNADFKDKQLDFEIRKRVQDIS